MLRQTVSQGGSSTIITSIDYFSITAVKELADAGAQIRHIKPSELRRCVIYDDSIAYFSIIEPTITHEAIESVDQTEGDDLWVASTEPFVIQSAKKRFSIDWNNAIPALDRINELEKGEPIEITRVIKDNREAIEIYKSLVSKAQSELIYLLPTSRALTRLSKIGIIESIKTAATARRVKVRMLTPIDSENLDIVEALEKVSPNLEIREHEQTTSTVLVVDRQELFTAELRNDAATETVEALGFSVYSNSKPTIESHVTLFESLWEQKELYSQLQMSATQLELANEQLKMHDRMQREFINIAAHELRTPIQPILGMADLLESNRGKNEQSNIELSKSDLELIIRNAKRLEKLSSDILEVTRIESDQLCLDKERINLMEIINSVIHDVDIRTKKNPSVQSEYTPRDVWMNADKGRITQVVSNLIDNAMKFTEGGKISISTEIAENGKIAVVSVKDTGSGIDSDMVPRLFTKFATKSEKGTGLGLYISRKIVEAHGGEIWAENNKEGPGAIFRFTLPITD